MIGQGSLMESNVDIFTVCASTKNHPFQFEKLKINSRSVWADLILLSNVIRIGTAGQFQIFETDTKNVYSSLSPGHSNAV